MQRDLIIGIDPDSDKFGVCLYKNKTEFKLISLDLFDLIDFITTNKDSTYVMEDILSTKSVYNQKGQGSRYLVGRANATGKCQHAAQLITRFFEREKLVLNLIKPLKGTKEIKTMLFNQLTKGVVKRCNQDQRDAYLIAHTYSERK